MAAGEDEAEAVVGDVEVVVVGVSADGAELRRDGVDVLFEPRFAADAVDGFVAGGLDDPGAGEIGHAGVAPLDEGGGKGFLGGLFGQGRSRRTRRMRVATIRPHSE